MAREMFVATGKYVKDQPGGFLEGKKGRPLYHSINEEHEHYINELMNQHVGECIIKMRGRKSTAPFIAKTIKVDYPKYDPDLIDLVKEESARRYQRPLKEIENELIRMEAEFSPSSPSSNRPLNFRQ